MFTLLMISADSPSPLKLKSDTVDAFNHFLNMVKNQFSTSIKNFQSNNGGEYKRLHQICATQGIKSRFSCPYTSPQNGRAERKHKHIVEMGLTLLAQASMLLRFWWDAFMTSTLIINGLPSPMLKGQSPMEKLIHRQLNFADLKNIWLCLLPMPHTI